MFSMFKNCELTLMVLGPVLHVLEVPRVLVPKADVGHSRNHGCLHLLQGGKLGKASVIRISMGSCTNQSTIGDFCIYKQFFFKVLKVLQLFKNKKISIFFTKIIFRVMIPAYFLTPGYHYQDVKKHSGKDTLMFFDFRASLPGR